uniref:Uncharacterized protein n=1 Tax=Bombyx mori TaxID=7091 RepID=A0A8R2R7Z5_BOMMO|nr:ferritin isoform X12 [Bombyx mori]
MADKTSEWRPGPTVCRCCLAEGCYKDISTEYFWMGKREVYAEMLAETFSVSIAYSKSGGPNSNSRLICEPCISRLRDASDFKKQVQECEKTFMQYLDPGSSSTTLESEVQTSSTDKRVKVEQVKIERQFSDDEFDSRDFGDDDDDDDMDQPLTTFASKEPKKETVNLMELLASPQLSVKRKAPAQTKTVSVKKVKVIKKDARGKPTTSKAAQKNEDKKKKELSPMHYARQNARTIVQYTTAYPFRLPESEMMCVYCCDKYPSPEVFRKHMEDTHPAANHRTSFFHHTEGYVKADCTELRCRICGENFDKLRAIAEHLKLAHNKNVKLEYGFGLQPYKLRMDRMWCGICGYKSVQLRSLSKHLQTHYLQFTCESCGKSYATNTSLQHHIKYSCSRVGNKPMCRTCRREFDNLEDKRHHYKDSSHCRLYVCQECGERFAYNREKAAHLEKVHDVPLKQHKCPECDEVFKKASSLAMHFRMVHTKDFSSCPSCDKKFPNEYKLNRHLPVHTGEKPFKCSVCSKCFPRKSTLNQHMWIHSEIKRFTCKICDKPFNQKVCWKTHMKSHHGVSD